MQVFVGQHQVFKNSQGTRQTFTENPTRKPFTNKAEIGDEVDTKSWKGNIFKYNQQGNNAKSDISFKHFVKAAFIQKRHP